MMVRQSMDWRRLLNYTVLRFESLLRKNGIKTESEDSCVIFEDTTLEKTGRKLEHITKVFDHVKMNYVLGYKLLLCLFFDGKSSLPFDFSIHEELGEKGDGGLGKKALRRRYSKTRAKRSPAYEREQECGMSKLDTAVKMLQRMWKCGLRPHYALADKLVCLREIHRRNQKYRRRNHTLHRPCQNGKYEIPRRRQKAQCRRTRCEIHKTD